jgi:hypothetical protein
MVKNFKTSDIFEGGGLNPSSDESENWAGRNSARLTPWSQRKLGPCTATPKNIILITNNVRLQIQCAQLENTYKSIF